MTGRQPHDLVFGQYAAAQEGRKVSGVVVAAAEAELHASFTATEGHLDTGRTDPP